jgi:hypothetical protein
MAFAQNKHMVEALASHAANKSLADGIRVWRSIRSLQYSNTGALGYSVEFTAELIVSIED